MRSADLVGSDFLGVGWIFETRWSRIGPECTLALREPSTRLLLNFSWGESVLAGGRREQKMAVRNRSESLVWGLIILALGVLLQIHFLKPELHILQNLWRFWPVLIIVLGVNKLLRYFAARSQEGIEPPK
jgi:hypothetical protein